MKKILLSILCVLVFAGTLILFFPAEEVHAEGWFCLWMPPSECAEMDMQSLVTQCNLEECYWAGEENQICLTCE